MSERWHLTPDSGAMKGNNPYQLNRTTVDPSFRSSGSNVDEIQGYSATGEIIYKSAAPKPETPCSAAYKALEAARKPTASLAAANQLPDVSPFHVDPPTSNPTPPSEQPVEGFSSRRRAHHRHHRQHGNITGPQSELQRITQEQYDRIMGRY